MKSRVGTQTMVMLMTAGLACGVAVASIGAQPEKPSTPPASPPPAAQPPAADEKAAQPEKPAGAPAKSDAKPANDPPVEDIIKDLQKPANERKTVMPDKPAATPTTPGAVPAPAAPTANAAPARVRTVEAGKSKIVREGTFIVSRKGRLVRATSGDWTFAFDSDTQQQAGNDPTMNILPCEKLMAMERVAEKHGEAVSYTVTGQVFVYHGRNFLMPTNYVVNRPGGDVKSLQ